MSNDDEGPRLALDQAMLDKLRAEGVQISDKEVADGMKVMSSAVMGFGFIVQKLQEMHPDQSANTIAGAILHVAMSYVVQNGCPRAATDMMVARIYERQEVRDRGPIQ